MNAYKNVSLSVWRGDCGKKSPMVTLNASNPYDENAEINYRPYDENAEINYNVWFVFTWDEFIAVTSGYSGFYADGYHKLETFGESWTFFDTDNIPMAPNGIAKLRYQRVTMPDRVCDKLRVLASMALVAYDATPEHEYRSKDRVTVDLSECLPQWLDEYGQGKGNVFLDCNQTTAEFIDECSSHGGNFDAMLDRVKQLARNTTRAKSDTASVQISKDWDGFFWSVPSSLHGGLINHGDKDSPDWGLHT